MGLFHWGKKTGTPQQEKHLTQEELTQIWKEAYQANPKVYEKEDGTLLAGFALTEDCDSLFPVAPEEQWAIKDKTISEWSISLISLTNPKGGVIGQIEYHEAMKRLAPYILAQNGNWVLIRKMTHGELQGLLV